MATTDTCRLPGQAGAIRLAAAIVAALLACAPAPGAAETAGKYEGDLTAFFTEVEATYPFFELKGIQKDWAATKERLSAKVKSCKSDTEFLGLVTEAMRCLRDAHMFLENAKAPVPPPPPEYYSGVSFLPAVNGGVAVMYAPQGYEAALRPGTVVLEIDGRSARQVLEDRAKEAWAAGGSFSSPQRARLYEYRIPLRGKKDEQHRITCLIGKSKRTLVLRATVEARGWPHTYNMPKGLVQAGTSVSYARLPGGAGFMYIRRVDESTEPALAEALKKLPDAKGWIVDLRGNGGGGYDDALIQAIKAMPRPVAVLIDAGCISAGETLARDFARYAEARLFGSTTAGSSTSKKHWAFPSGIASVQISVRSRWRADGKPIEFNGVEPDVVVEADPQELAKGLNSDICRAQEYLREALQKK